MLFETLCPSWPPSPGSAGWKGQMAGQLVSNSQRASFGEAWWVHNSRGPHALCAVNINFVQVVGVFLNSFHWKHNVLTHKLTMTTITQHSPVQLGSNAEPMLVNCSPVSIPSPPNAQAQPLADDIVQLLYQQRWCVLIQQQQQQQTHDHCNRCFLTPTVLPNISSTTSTTSN